MQQEPDPGAHHAKATSATTILALERTFLEALRDEDFESVLALTHDPCVLVGPEGHGSLSRSAFEDMLRGSPDKLERFRFLGEPRVRFLSPDVAVVTYGLLQELTLGASSRAVFLEAYEASTWLRTGGRWRVAAHSETVRGDPYGRDRLRQP